LPPDKNHILDVAIRRLGKAPGTGSQRRLMRVLLMYVTGKSKFEDPHSLP